MLSVFITLSCIAFSSATFAFEIPEANPPHGGAVATILTNVTLGEVDKEITLSGNKGLNGGAIHSQYGNFSIDGTVDINNNTSTGTGGGGGIFGRELIFENKGVLKLNNNKAE